MSTRHFNRPLLCTLLLLSTTLPGCVSQTPKENFKPEPIPWPQDNAPTQLVNLAKDIDVFQATVNHLPESLAQLREAQLDGNRVYSEQEFAYHPAGIGILRNGWRLVVASSKMEGNQLWCIVSPPVRLSSAPRFRVVRISLIELRESAAAAENVRIKQGLSRPEEKTNVDRIRDMVK